MSDDNAVSDNVPIMIDVEGKNLWPVLKVLDSTPGIVTIHLKMAHSSSQAVRQLEDKRVAVPARRQLARGPYNKVAAETLRGAVIKALGKAPLHTKVLREIVARIGHQEASLYPTLNKLLVDGYIKRTAPGTYRLTARGQKRYAPIIGNSEVKEKHWGKVVNNSTGVRGLILRELSKSNMDRDEVTATLKGNGYSTTNMYNAVKRLTEEGLVKRTGDDFEITEIGRDAIAPEISNAISVNKVETTGETV